MARQRASQARAAFARVGTVQVSGADDDSASEPASNGASLPAGIPASISAGENARENASLPAFSSAGVPASIPASVPASAGASRKARGKRRAGRPRGPARVSLSIRILAANDERLTAAVDLTGQSPQYVVDTALAAYFDSLGIPLAGGQLR